MNNAWKHIFNLFFICFFVCVNLQSQESQIAFLELKQGDSHILGDTDFDIEKYEVATIHGQAKISHKIIDGYVVFFCHEGNASLECKYIPIPLQQRKFKERLYFAKASVVLNYGDSAILGGPKQNVLSYNCSMTSGGPSITEKIVDGYLVLYRWGFGSCSLDCTFYFNCLDYSKKSLNFSKHSLILPKGSSQILGNLHHRVLDYNFHVTHSAGLIIDKYPTC